MLDLSAKVQRAIPAGEAERVAPAALRGLASLPSASQWAAFEHTRDKAGDGAPVRPTSTLARLTSSLPSEVRVVVVLNPQRFIEQRLASRRHRDKLEAFVEELGRRLRSPRSRRTRDQVLTDLGAELRHRGLEPCYKVDVRIIEQDGREFLQASLTLDAEAYRQRRSADGLSLIVAQADIPTTAAELLGAYFGEDTVEKDFQTIKSALELRPFNHLTDLKVRAHVTLCMLASLAERTIEQRMAAAGIPMSAVAALEELGCCHLSQYVDEDTTLYNITQPTPDQTKILDALALPRLADEDALAQEFTSRLRCSTYAPSATHWGYEIS